VALRAVGDDLQAKHGGKAYVAIVVLLWPGGQS
jgi:hypothetical protein